MEAVGAPTAAWPDGSAAELATTSGRRPRSWRCSSCRSARRGREPARGSPSGSASRAAGSLPARPRCWAARLRARKNSLSSRDQRSRAASKAICRRKFSLDMGSCAARLGLLGSQRGERLRDVVVLAGRAACRVPLLRRSSDFAALAALLLRSSGTPQLTPESARTTAQYNRSSAGASCFKPLSRNANARRSPGTPSVRQARATLEHDCADLREALARAEDVAVDEEIAVVRHRQDRHPAVSGDRAGPGVAGGIDRQAETDRVAFLG